MQKEFPPGFKPTYLVGFKWELNWGCPVRSNLVQVVAGCLRPARNLGAIIDDALKLSKQVSLVIKSSCFQQRFIAEVKTISEPEWHWKSRPCFYHLSLKATETPCLLEWNWASPPAALLLTGTNKHEHITLVLSSLLWLPVKYRINFKILLFVFTCLSGLAPEYLCDLIALHRPSRALHLANQMVLKVPRSHLKTTEGRAFSDTAPTLWKALPLTVQQPLYL